MREQEKVAWGKVGLIRRMRDNSRIFFVAKTCCTLKALWARALSW